MKLVLDRLDFGYSGKPVGQDVSLSVEAGEILCLLGPNGGGKTTLFKTLLGLLPIQAGSVTLDGVELRHRPRRELARLMAYVPQAHTAYFPYSVLDIVLMGRTAHLGLFATPSAQDMAVAAAVLATLQIADLRDAVYTQISGGQRQLVMIARALAQEPRFLVLDEPTASLDFGNQVLVLSQIRDLARQGIGIILSTHDPDHVFACADRVALLHRGALLAAGRPQEVMTPTNLRRLYGVDVEVVRLVDSERWICIPRLG